MTRPSKFPGWRHMTAAQRYNARKDAIFEEAKRLAALRDSKTYKIVRFYKDPATPARTLESGLSLEEARAHCNDPETSSRTATGKEARAHTWEFGEWFDGYREE